MCSNELEKLRKENEELRAEFTHLSNVVMKAQEEGIITDTIWTDSALPITLFENLDHITQKYGIQTELVL